MGLQELDDSRKLVAWSDRVCYYPQRACAARVTVLGLSVCLSVCLSTRVQATRRPMRVTNSFWRTRTLILTCPYSKPPTCDRSHTRHLRQATCVMSGAGAYATLFRRLGKHFFLSVSPLSLWSLFTLDKKLRKVCPQCSIANCSRETSSLWMRPSLARSLSLHKF